MRLCTPAAKLYFICPILKQQEPNISFALVNTLISEMKAGETSVSVLITIFFPFPNILQVSIYTFDGFYVASENEVRMQGLKY